MDLTDHKTLDAFVQRHPSIRFVRLYWLDYTSTLRVRVLTITHLRSLATQGRYHGLGRLYMTLIDSDAPLAQNDPKAAVGQNSLVPDYSSLRMCPWMEGHAIVFCYFGEAADTSQDKDGEREPCTIFSPLCPRKALSTALQNSNALGMTFLVGFEIEFTCYPSKNNSAGSDIDATIHQASGCRTIEAMMLPILCQVADVLCESGIPVHHFHAESDKDQYEIVTAPMSPMDSADALIFTREAIRNICKTHSMEVSFHPYHPSDNGTHLNISLSHDATIEGEEENFLAGIMDNMSALFALGLPRPESYKRVVPGRQMVGSLKAWGTENRETPIRKKGKRFWEVRIMDASANVYLFLAGLLSVGMSGVILRSSLFLTDCNVDPAMLTPEERMSFGINQLLPTTPEAAYDALQTSEVLLEQLGSQLILTYIRLMKKYNDILEALGPMESEARIDWLTKRL